MCLVFCGIGIVLIIVGVVRYYITADTDCGIPWWGIGGVVLALSLIATFIFAGFISDGTILDQKIAMYEEENAKIEQQISDLVSNYMDYEGSTLEKFSPESSITLVNLYPELKSSELVTKQLDIYYENRETIKKMKADLLALPIQKWWLYFGG